MEAGNRGYQDRGYRRSMIEGMGCDE